jgi:hypothetical protein
MERGGELNMGVAQAILHFFATVVLKAIIIWCTLVFLLDIPVQKSPMLMLIVFIAEIIAKLVASLLLRGYRGY